MKKFLLFLVIAITSITASAEVINFRTTSYTHKENYGYGYGWTDWAPFAGSNMKITVNTNTDIVTIYSPRTQKYKIIDYLGVSTDRDGDETITLKFIDQDGDYGTMRLVTRRRSGKSEIYIDFANVMWVYSVVRL